MNDKLSLQDLADILCQQIKISKKDAEFFFKEFFQLILDRIYENDLVKIKDFGTFKLTAINSRESVDVNTGEKIEIPAHHRFTFLPDKVLKELVNEPFSKYQTVLLEEGMDPSDVKFELQMDTEDEKDDDDSFDDNEVSKIIQEQAKLVNELKAQVVDSKEEEVKPIAKRPKIDLIEKVSKTTSTRVEDTQRVSRKPFIYTYSTSKTDEDKKDEDVILITVPRGRISKIGEEINIPEIQGNNKPKPQSVSVKDIETKKEKREISEQKVDLGVASKVSSNKLEAEESLIEIDTTIYSISDDIDTKEAVGSSFEKGTDRINLDNQQKSASIKPTAISNKTESELPSGDYTSKFKENYSILTDQKQASSVKPYSTKSNPDRPLIPDETNSRNLQPKSISTKTISSSIDNLEEIDIDTTFIDTDESDVNKFRNGSVVDASVGADSREETDELDVQNDPFFNFEDQSAKKAKLKKNTPIIILVIVALFVIGYSLFQLLDVKYDYERYLGLDTSDLTEADTLPGMYQEDKSLALVTSDTTTIQDYNDSLSDQNAVIVDRKTPVAVQGEKSNSSITENTDGSILIDGSGDVLNREIENTGAKRRKVSNNLSINIVDKAQYFLEKRNEAKNSTNAITGLIESQVNNVETDKSQKRGNAGNNGNVIKLEKGMTLRSVASKYYGNSNYWVYIYMTNKDKLPDPDAIMVGLELSIPPLNQYGVIDPKDPKEIERAQKLESSIL